MLLRVVLASAMAFLANPLFAGDKKEKNHPVKPAELFALIDRADKVVVYDTSPYANAKVLYSSSAPKDISELKAAISIEPPEEWFRCACIGSPEIRLFRKDKELVRIIVYEGSIVGCSLWTSDARIKNLERWLQWFDARKIAGPRQEAEQQRAQEEAARASAERWMSAMPGSLRPVWPKAMETMEPGPTPDTKTLDLELAREFPDVAKRIRALMSWFGSGAGPWSGFPMYESVAEEMLLEYQTSELLAAVQGATLSEQETEGAARLLAGWNFNTRRPGDNALIPAELKRSLLVHALKNPDEDRVARARRAFEQR